MTKTFKQETEVGSWLLDRGMRVQISLKELLTKEDATALNYHIKVAADIVSKYTEDKVYER